MKKVYVHYESIESDPDDGLIQMRYASEVDTLIAQDIVVMRKQRERIAELEKAFKWVLENEVWFDRFSKKFYEYMGQGETQTHSGPPDIVAVVSSLMDR